MNTPVLFLQEPVLPGLAPEITLEPSQAQALHQWHQWMGFGTLEVALAFPADPTRPAGPDNHLPIGTLADALLPNPEVPVLAITDSQRVRLREVVPHKTHSLCVVQWEEAEPSVVQWQQEHFQALHGDLYRALLIWPELLHQIAGEDAQVPVSELEEAPPWAAIYVAAMATEVVKDSRELLEADDLSHIAYLASEALRKQLGQEEELDLQVQQGAAVMLEQGVELRLQDAAAALESLSLLQSLGVVQLRGDQNKTLRGLRKEIDRLIPLAQRLIEQLEG